MTALELHGEIRGFDLIWGSRGVCIESLYSKHGGSDELLFMILAVPFLSATGIYNPPVVQHGRCIAEPGTFNALFCMGVAEAPNKQKYRAR